MLGDDPRCRVCSARILWGTTEYGKPIPLDREPNQQGNVAAARDGTGRLRARILSVERPTREHHERLYMPHFATCSARTGGRH